MTAKKHWESELQKLTIGGKPGLRTLHLDQAHQVELALIAIDPLACSFERLTLSAPELDSATADQLKGVAASLTRRLSYLLEPVHVLEADEEARIVQMRSVPPSQDEEATSYYEVTVRRGAIDLRRYAKSKGQPRQIIPTTVTREVLFRLTQDLVQAAGVPHSQ